MILIREKKRNKLSSGVTVYMVAKHPVTNATLNRRQIGPSVGTIERFNKMAEFIAESHRMMGKDEQHGD